MARVGPSLALVAYADAWLSAAKVVVFGDATSTLPEQLVERGARMVYVFDHDPARVAEATQRSSSPHVSFAPIEQAATLTRDGAFDLGIVEDIGSGAVAARTLETLARALGRRGVALIATRNPDVTQRLIEASSEPALGYYELHELVRGQFQHVRMLGQSPFVGYAVVDFGAENEEDIAFDTGLVPGGAEQPEWFLALASQRELEAGAFSVIQLPFAGIAPKAPRHAEIERARLAEKRALARVAKLEAELAEQARAGSEAPSLRAEVERLQAALAERDKWLTGLEERAATADQRADDMQAELERLRDSAVAKAQELDRLRGPAGEGARRRRGDDERGASQELSALRQKLEELRHKYDEAKKQRDDLQKQLAEAQKQADETRRQRESARGEQDELRSKLDEQRRQLTTLQKKLDEETRRAERALADQVALQNAAADATRRLEEQSKELGELTKKLAEGEAEPNDDIARLEEQLRERGREVARLEAALVETERFGKRLLAELEALRDAPKEATLEQLDRLAQKNAELAADLEATRWTIAQLEAASGALGKKPTATVDAVDASVQRQAVLLEQAGSGPVG